ncbi:TonB-dependent receptor [Granulicella sp. L60]|uniref:TonB-dependent receptor n=1 Tax=Granulicella sp. L60 TaxID=1641866 RepID=UPI00131C38C0|nr:carboxypeptidase regulatory-like domain-containing protein [Granulicella sp. L60]
MPYFRLFFRRFVCSIFIILLSATLQISALAQTSSASLALTVTDSSGAVVPDAEVALRAIDTNQEQHSISGRTGTTTFPFLKPGHYSLAVSKSGFSEISVDNLLLNVGDDKHLNLILKVGAAHQSVTVDGSGATINISNASVSTVIDRKFVENIPLNGRSFQGLILLAPGAITNSPQRAAGVLGTTGEFSINGQRTESNYYTVDGVSANTGVPLNNVSPAAGGSLSASTALGTTQGLVSVDALQEFRVESSTYSAEYGRNPGGQFSMVTRSGTNDWHGTAFDYFRNDVLDANSWFNDNTTPVTNKTAERQNDFGGTLGGPIRIPRLYDGTNQSFFFFSYEGLRLVVPSPATVNAVPDLALRHSTTGPLQQALNAFPLPTLGYPDLVSGMGQFVGAWSNPSQADAISARIDHNFRQRIHFFFRFSNTPSDADSRGISANDGTPSVITSSAYTSRTYTFGTTANLSERTNNDFKLNFSTNTNVSTNSNDNFGGAVPVDLFAIQGIPREGASITVDPVFGGYFPELNETGAIWGQQKQWNLVDSIAIQHGKHAFKIGIDWRRLAPTIPVASRSLYELASVASILANSVDVGLGESFAAQVPVYTNFSAYLQDEWKATSRLALSMGVRWDINPSPGVSHGLMPYTVLGFNKPATMTLAPQGTPLWKTDWLGIAPRMGVAYLLHNDAGKETVIRGGGGVFFDTGQQTGSQGFSGPGFTAVNYFGTVYGTASSFPVAPSTVTPTITNPPTAPYGNVYANPSHFQLPYTLQWNVSLEQALDRSESVTLSYVGANGRKLLREDESNVSAINPNFDYLFVFSNGLTSSYNALQVKYQRQIARGLQALASYTWSHALDYGSYSAALPYEHGNSDLDVRHNVAAAVSYDLPHGGRYSWLNSLTSHWGIDGRFTARTGFPITLNGNSIIDPANGATEYGGLNLVADVPLILHGSMYPGRRRINPAAFTVPTSGQTGSAPRNFVTGFGAIQGDVAIRRSFPIYDKLRGQFRVEAFNISNHPNFGMIGATCGGAVAGTCANVQFGLATQILAQSLGNLSPLYQMGGPRSLQLNLKLSF